MKKILTFLTLVVLPGLSGAQEVALPPGPLVAKVGKMEAWEIDFSYSSSDKDDEHASASSISDPTDMQVESSKTKKVRITSTYPLWHVEIIKSLGRINQWFDGSSQYTILPKLGAYRVMEDYEKRSSSNGNDIRFENHEFPDMGWLSSKNYIGLQTIGNVECYSFAEKDRQAWIAVETRRPVAWRRGSETRIFKRLPTPSAMLEVPNAIAIVEKSVQADTDRLAHPIPPRN